MALEPGYTYNTITGSTSPDVKTSISAPLVQYSRTVTVSGTLTSLTPEQCQKITIYNSGSGPLYLSVNSGSAIQPLSNTSVDFAVDNAAEVRVSGSAVVLSYIVSK